MSRHLLVAPTPHTRALSAHTRTSHITCQWKRTNPKSTVISTHLTRKRWMHGASSEPFNAYAQVIIVPHRIIWSWYSGRWRVGCYICYKEEGTGWGRSPPRPLLAVTNVTARLSTASVPITVLLYNGQLLCGFNVPAKGLIKPKGKKLWRDSIVEKIDSYSSGVTQIRLGNILSKRVQENHLLWSGGKGYVRVLEMG